MSSNNESDADVNNCESSSSLEHALLESLFYNEMMMMDDSSSCISSDFMAFLSSNLENPPGAPDAGAIAEKDMLRDFGVSPNSVPTDAPLHSGLRISETDDRLTNSTQQRQ
jgi:hypothetical protein